MRVLLAPSLMLWLAACAPMDAALDAAGASAAESSIQDPQRPPPFEPPPPDDTASDWIRLVSGEWLRGEIHALREEVLEFESNELDELELDWENVAELRSSRHLTILLESGATVSGTLLVRNGQVQVGGATPSSAQRAELMAIVPQYEHEVDRWSGKVSLGLTTRSGNTEQSDLTAFGFARRETPATRWDTSYNGAFSQVEGVETANNHRLRSQFDWFLTNRLYVIPAGVDGFRDTFQNIAYRITPFAGFGYDVIDAKKVSWSISTGPAYQYVRNQTVGPGEDKYEGSGAGFFSSRFHWDVTADVALDLDYDLTMPVPETDAYNHRLTALLSVDLIGDFDLDVAFVWDRVNDPRPNDMGFVPEKDDFRTTVGLGYTF